MHINVLLTVYCFIKIDYNLNVIQYVEFAISILLFKMIKDKNWKYIIVWCLILIEWWSFENENLSVHLKEIGNRIQGCFCVLFVWITVVYMSTYFCMQRIRT